LLEAGFTEVRISFDKKKSSPIPWLLITFPFIKLFGALTNKRETKKNNVGSDNEVLVSQINTVDMLLGRTIIVSAYKN
jgi:hypothetical protein